MKPPENRVTEAVAGATSLCRMRAADGADAYQDCG